MESSTSNTAGCLQRFFWANAVAEALGTGHSLFLGASGPAADVFDVAASELATDGKRAMVFRPPFEPVSFIGDFAKAWRIAAKAAGLDPTPLPKGATDFFAVLFDEAHQLVPEILRQVEGMLRVWPGMRVAFSGLGSVEALIGPAGCPGLAAYKWRRLVLPATQPPAGHTGAAFKSIAAPAARAWPRLSRRAGALVLVGALTMLTVPGAAPEYDAGGHIGAASTFAQANPFIDGHAEAAPLAAGARGWAAGEAAFVVLGSGLVPEADHVPAQVSVAPETVPPPTFPLHAAIHQLGQGDDEAGEAPLPRPLQPALTQAMIRRGLTLLKQGDVSGARLLLGRAADAGSGAAALAMGTTFDAATLGRLGTVGIRPDQEAASVWYRLALQRGEARARTMLDAPPAPRTAMDAP